MKKKLYTVLTMACLLLVSSVSLVACGHEHDYASVWSKDETHHWHECTIEDCEEVSDKAEHTASDWIVDTQATHATDGTKHKECTECGYIVDTTTISATGHAMTTTSTYVVEDNKAYEVYECSCGDTERRELSNYVVATVDTAQTLLDNAADGVTIVLDSGNYGTLYLRKNDRSTEVTSAWNGYQFKRVVNGLTLIGTEGTTLTKFVAEAGQFGINLTPQIPHTLSDTYPNLSTYIDITNLTIKNITFNLEENDVAVDVASTNHTSINGLTIDGCIVNGKNSTISDGNRLLESTKFQANEVLDGNDDIILTTYRKNITISNCVLNNLHQGVRMHYVENLTIKNNEFNNTKGRDLLLGGSASQGELAGTTIIEGNTSTGSTERFARMLRVSGDMIIRNNVISNYQGADEDMLKITNPYGNDWSITLTNNDWNGLNDVTALSEGKIAYPTK